MAQQDDRQIFPVTKIHVYWRQSGWAYSAWDDEGGYDHSDTLDAESCQDAMQQAQELFPSARVVAVEDF